MWDYKTIMGPIPSALVKFKTPLIGTITNTTDLGGKTVISLSLEKKQQHESCITALISQGYSIEATTKGFIGQGIGAISYVVLSSIHKRSPSKMKRGGSCNLSWRRSRENSHRIPW